MKMYLISDNVDTLTGMRLAGVDGVVVHERDELKEVIEKAVLHTPSAFNSQTARIVVLWNKEHDKFWDITRENLRKIVPAESFASTDEKITSFQNGYATVLFFEDQDVVKGLQEAFPLYSQNFPVWSQQSSGMHQYVVWSALELEGYGASLQHYNEIVESDIKKEWSIPDHWKLIAQMPFGKPTALPGDKEFSPLEGRIRHIG